MSRCYRFGSFVLDAAGRRLKSGDTRIEVTSRAFDILVLLIEARDRVVSRNEIFDRVWPDTAVEDNNLSQQIHKLRRLLPTDESGGSLVATIPGRGFRFVGAVEEVSTPDVWPDARPASRAEQPGVKWPVPPDALIGREEDVDRVVALMGRHPFVTLTGPGGVGKTRLAMEAGWRLQRDGGINAVWIDLTRATCADDLAPLTAEALGFADTGGRTPVVRLRDWLADKDYLLVFDNFEHVLDAAPLLLQLRSPGGRLRFLSTSRALLSVRGEHEFAVAPLRCDAATSGGDPTRAPAVRLFFERFRAKTSGGTAEPDAADVATLCARLDGLPLAIELAAARATLVAPREMVARDRLVDFLPNGPRDAPARQRSILDAIGWSYAMLEPQVQHALQILAVFTGGFSPDAGCAVLVDAGAAPNDGRAFDAIDALRRHSLVAFERDHHISRLRMLETVREFTTDVRSTTDDETARHAHRQWVTRAFTREDYALRSTEFSNAMERLVPDHGNLLAALRSASASEDAHATADLANSAALFWYTANLFREGGEWIDTAIAVGDRTGAEHRPADVRLIAMAALMSYHRGAMDDCQAKVTRVLTHPEVDTSTTLAKCLQAVLKAYRGDLGAASVEARDALAHAERQGDRWLVGHASLVDAYGLSLGGDHAGAYGRLAACPRDVGFLGELIRVNFGLQALAVGKWDEAAGAWSAVLRRRFGAYVPARLVAGGIEGLAYVAGRRGEMRTSALLLAAADRLRSQTAPLLAVWFEEHDRAVDNARKTFGDRLEQVWAEGSSLSVEEAVELASSVAPKA